MSATVQIHRELVQRNGYSLQLDGINYVSPGNRYIGVTYGSQMQEFLSGQIVGKAAWDTVLAASDKLEPIAIFQFLPTVNGMFFLAFRTPYGIYGLNDQFDVSGLKYNMKVFRSSEEYGWVFKNALMYVKQSNKLFDRNPFQDCVLSSNIKDWKFAASKSYEKPIKSWSEFVADGQDGTVDAVILPYGRAYYGINDPFGSYNNLQPPSSVTSSVTFQREIDRNSAMAIELEAQRRAKLDLIQAQANAPYIGMPVTGWYTPSDNSYQGSIKEDWPWATPPIQPEPATPVLKAKHGRMIIFAKEGE